jgi:hypothetical protein
MAKNLCLAIGVFVPETQRQVTQHDCLPTERDGGVTIKVKNFAVRKIIFFTGLPSTKIYVHDKLSEKQRKDPFSYVLQESHLSQFQKSARSTPLWSLWFVNKDSHSLWLAASVLYTILASPTFLNLLRSLGIDSQPGGIYFWAPQTFINLGSGLKLIIKRRQMALCSCAPPKSMEYTYTFVTMVTPLPPFW